MAVRVKRTYNLSSEIVRKVKDLVEEGHLAPSQDALVEMALEDFFRARRDAEEAQIWAAAARDPELAEEAAELEAEFRTAEGETWPD